MEKKHKNLLVWGGVAVIGGIVAYNMLKPKPVVAATTAKTNFIGRTPYSNVNGKKYANQTGNECTNCSSYSGQEEMCGIGVPLDKVTKPNVCTSCVTYSLADIQQAKKDLRAQGLCDVRINYQIQSSVLRGEPITQSQLCSGCSSFTTCDPALCINWWNPFSWHL